MAVRTLGDWGVRRRWRQAMATATRRPRISRCVPFAGGRSMTVSIAALERLPIIAWSPTLSFREPAKHDLGAPVAVEMPGALNVGRYLVALAALNRTMRHTLQ